MEFFLFILLVAAIFLIFGESYNDAFVTKNQGGKEFLVRNVLAPRDKSFRNALIVNTVIKILFNTMFLISVCPTLTQSRKD